MNIFGIHFHSWRAIKIKTTKIFLDEEYQGEEITRFRICNECLKVQEYFFDSQGGCWETLQDKKREILLDKIYRENDNWYFREKQKKPFEGFRPPAGRPKPSNQNPPMEV